MTVPAGRGIEYKFYMKQHEMTYEWLTDGAPLYFDLHGEPEGDTTGYFESYHIAATNEMKAVIPPHLQALMVGTGKTNQINQCQYSYWLKGNTKLLALNNNEFNFTNFMQMETKMNKLISIVALCGALLTSNVQAHGDRGVISGQKLLSSLQHIFKK